MHLPDFKYYAKIEAVQAKAREPGETALPQFDLKPFVTTNPWAQRLSRFVFRAVMPAVFACCRLLWPIPRFGRMVIVTRDADVREVLNRSDVFSVPYGPEMTELAGGTTSVLGLEGDEHDKLRETIKTVLKPGDLDSIRRWSRGYAKALIEGSAGEIDVFTDLITRTATETCCRYFGLTANDPNAFAEWTLSVSAQLFADPFGDPAVSALARNGAARIRIVLEDAIARVHNNNRRPDHGAGRPHVTLIDRFVTDTALSDAQISATLMGLAVGFIPTCTLAAGNMLEVLLNDRAMMEDAQEAARTGNDGKLKAILLQAGKDSPALSPGQWRYTVRDGVIAEGTRRERFVPKGSMVLVAIMSALADPRADTAADDVEAASALMFGAGPHLCLGKYVAIEMIVQIFAELLSQPNLRVSRGEHGWMQRMSAFPVRLDMTFDSMCATQTMAIICAPVRDGTPRAEIERQLDALGNPARDDVRDALGETEIVHFASMSVIEAAPGDPGGSIMLLELNLDGPRDKALEIVAEKGLGWLGPIIAHADRGGRVPEDAPALAKLLRRYAIDLHCKPWGPIGIHYNGTPEFAVRDIRRQEQLAQFARQALAPFFRDNLGQNSRAMDALTHVRRLVKRDSMYMLRHGPGYAAPAGDEDLEFKAVRPSRKRLAIADWEPPASIWAPFLPLLRSEDGKRITDAFILLWLIGTLGGLIALDPPAMRSLAVGSLHDAGYNIGALALASIGGLGIALFATLLVIGVFALLVYASELRDPVDDRPARFDHVADVSSRENQPGYEQNHILAVMPLKPGMLRKLTFAFALWGIAQTVRYWFRPGFVVTMGTIHYAKWFRVPGTEQFVFLSNYDGTWENYLEDFITRAHWGQSAAWSNGVGFPRTRLLIFDGAADGDRFKRWVRRQQRATRFWYSRFPHLTTKQIRNNALIEDGLARAMSDTDARRWLSCFGSAQREDHSLETAEIQSIVFGGYGNLHHASCLVLRLPEDANRRIAWVRAVTGIASDAGSRKGDPAPPLQVTFGDHPVADGTAVLGFSAAGLHKLGLSASDGEGGLADFPPAFNFGMARRERVLGDHGAESVDAWAWSDLAESAEGAEAVLILYGERGTRRGEASNKRRAHASLVEEQKALLESFGGRVLHIVPTGPTGPTPKGWKPLEREHFGFRDGISQPVIRGTQRAAATQPAARDIAEPGEIILGYRNNQGYYPPLLSVPDESDLRNDLPVADVGPPGRFPRFGTVAAGAGRRDFGRNGTFLVIRQFDQDVEGFERFTTNTAARINDDYRHLKSSIGQGVEPDWVAAKLVGRWRDGSPLVGNPIRPGGRREDGDNDFAYGIHDPQGLQCPLGAHIRRANPRDSLEPGDASEEQISNRHRLLRRGRSYHYRVDPDGSRKKGLLFMALCSDIERQFEFVQHSWINAPSFHGLSGEPDPLLGAPPVAAAGQTAPAPCFTIPAPGGPIVLQSMERFVTVRAGGYFFLPSRAALQYLCATPSRITKQPAGGRA